ncbi:selenoprotein N isoform X2 [Penaeus vannamei]|uniref:selenoprotein N isoform X2 n=1 Tax=Penaeus vannamei TaxID=6689 RepID=UPI00387F4471
MTSIRKRKSIKAELDRGPEDRTLGKEDNDSREDKVDRKLDERENHNVKSKVPPAKTYLLYILSFLLGFALIWLWPFTHQASKHRDDATLLTLHTHFTPVAPKAFDSFIDREESRSSLHGILTWKTASVAWSWIHPHAFAALLPAEGIDAKPSHVWRLIPDTSQEFMYRYGPRGAAAVLRAKNFDSLDIIFRLHAEYQLNTPPRRPLWFTPAAFMGRLVINMTDYSVQHFVMEVPTQQQLNVDLEWLIGPNEDEDMEVTITRLEQMQLSAEGLLDPGSLLWSQEIAHEKAHDLLEKELYRYKQVEYHNFTKAFVKGSKEHRPVHTLVLWGVLEDQSC